MKKVVPYKISICSNISAIDIFIKGKSFLKPRKLYLSASNEMMFDNIRTFDPFASGTETQKNAYPPFRGIIVPTFNVLDEKFLLFNFPQQPKNVGFVDVIMENEAGYGKLTKDTLLPYFSTFNGSENIQFPWISGIEITYYKNDWSNCSDIKEPIFIPTLTTSPTVIFTITPTPTINQTTTPTVTPTPNINNLVYSPEFILTLNFTLTSDSDSDGYSDQIEDDYGTDKDDPLSFPIDLFNTFNGI